MRDVHFPGTRDVWAEPVVVPPQVVRQLSPRPGGSVVAQERIWEHGRLLFAPGAVVEHDEAIRLGLIPPDPPPPEPVGTVEVVNAMRAAAQKAARRRRIR